METVCARAAGWALLWGPSTSPLEITCNEATAMGRTSHQPHICFLILSTLLLSSCLTVTPAPGSDKVRVTRNPADVAACKAVGNIVVPKTSNGTVDMATAATDFRNRTIGSLDYVELGFLLDEAGVRLSEGQLSRLRPYLVPLRRLEAAAGQLRTKACVFACRGSAALAIDDTFATLLVGQTEGASALRDVERYASIEMALRVFLSAH